MFGISTGNKERTITAATIMGKEWELFGYGDTIPSSREDPTNDHFKEVLRERNQCLSIHLSAGFVYGAGGKDCPPPAASAQVQARKIRLEQYTQSIEFHKAVSEALDHEPLIMVELRAHAHDALNPHHDRDRRSLICFAPNAIAECNICVIRVSPSCRFATHVIQSPKPSDIWICLLAHQEHMRLETPGKRSFLDDLIRSPQSAAQPVGWKSLMELGPMETTIATKCLGRCPHCQQTGVRLPLGVEGSIIGSSAMLSDFQLREFSIEKPWAARVALEM